MDLSSRSGTSCITNCFITLICIFWLYIKSWDSLPTPKKKIRGPLVYQADTDYHVMILQYILLFLDFVNFQLAYYAISSFIYIYICIQLCVLFTIQWHITVEWQIFIFFFLSSTFVYIIIILLFTTPC